MQSFVINNVNVIADNLRDRYQSGFPILKELIQNADDANARTLIFEHHPGFPEARHPLLRGPGLWFFNDGDFKESDATALRSIAINNKAGDAHVIGKFGLGMKSVFHLCEALFYVARDGNNFHCQGLNPWKQDSYNIHPEWDVPPDWEALKRLGSELASAQKQSWFLLWLPLRMKRHLQTRSGEETDAIISRFPGDDPSGELGFLDTPELPRDIAKMLPLLLHLEHIEYKSTSNSFALDLSSAGRLIGKSSCESSDGEVLKAGEDRLLAFSGLRSESTEEWFKHAKGREEWPSVLYQDRLGHTRKATDKSSPEAAVLFCADYAAIPSSRLHWAVFLPVGEGDEKVEAEGCKLGHSIILHGQFFLDAGRKNIEGFKGLHEEVDNIEDTQNDESRLRTAWNKKLTQDVLLPLVLPALDRYTTHLKLSTSECHYLTKAIANTDWFDTFKWHICRNCCWVRLLKRNAQAGWNLVEGATRHQLRPLPPPPNSAPERPWEVFPALATRNLMPYDAQAPGLWDRRTQWQWGEAELEHLLSRVNGLFTKGPSMDYLGEFLETCAGWHFSTNRVQNKFLSLLRHGLRTTSVESWRQVTVKASRLIGLLESERRLALSAELPDSILKKLWAIDAPILLVPKGMDAAEPGKGSPDESTLISWLRVLDGELGKKRVATSTQEAILEVVHGLLHTLGQERRREFLQDNQTLRVIGVLDAKTEAEKAVSFEKIEQIRTRGTLFGYASGLTKEARMGLTPLLARVIPDAEVCLVRTRDYRALFLDEGELSRADDGEACLAAIGCQDTGRLGSLEARQRLLEKANDPGADRNSLRGLRLLLHGKVKYRDEDSARLWIGRHGQHPAWKKLWAAVHEDKQWSLIPEKLADAVPRTIWTQATIAEIDSRNLLEELEGLHRSDSINIERPEEFSIEERDEILSFVKDKGLWKHLPFHMTVAGKLVPATGENVYLALDQKPREPLAQMALLIAPGSNKSVAEQQKNWLKPFDEHAVINIALGSEEPVRYWRDIMDAWGSLSGDVTEKLLKLIQSEAWLPTVHGTPVKPEDVINLPGSLMDETHRLVAKHRAEQGPCFAVPDEIDRELRNHAAWERVRTEAFASGNDALGPLGLLLEDLPAYRVGKWRGKPSEAVVKLLARCESFPGWRLLKADPDGLFEPNVLWEQLAPSLSKPLDAERVVEMLQWLSSATEQWEDRKCAHDSYLEQLPRPRDPEIARRLISGLRLASRDRKWNDAATLCSGAHGVIESRVLDDGQVKILGDLIHRPQDLADGVRDAVFHAAQDEACQIDQDKAPELLRDYFCNWDPSLVPPPFIGTLLGLLGPTIRELTNEYLRPHSFDWLVERLPWRDPGRINERIEWMGEKTADQALELIKAVVRVESSDEVEVPNLLGQKIRVALDEEIKTLIAGALSWHGRGYGVTIPFRHVEPGRFEAAQLSELLRRTAERLYLELYNQPKVSFDELWKELDQSYQLEINTARTLILEAIPFYLMQLSVKEPGIEQQLNDYNKRRRSFAEAIERGSSGKSLEQNMQEKTESLEALACCIEENKNEQHAVLEAVRNKLKQYQYDLWSIPFELYQNADDAMVELGDFPAYSHEGSGIPADARRFVVDEREDSIAFLHWGRPINAQGPVGFRDEGRGYDLDLEKMLILLASGKGGDEGSTGKFGLGFKSVLLACEQPRILSGQLAVRVVAGMLPQIWEDPSEARQRMVEISSGLRLPGTLIDLPGVDSERQTKILARFRQFAGILCVFGRALRHIRTVSASESDWSWQPTSEIDSRLEIGQLDVPGERGARTTALCIRTETGSLLMALGPQGFRPLPGKIPSIWVTAPTCEELSVGFAVNGSFELDVGRGKLAWNVTENLKKAQQIGSETGDALKFLLEKSVAEWPAVRAELKLLEDVDSLTFWESIWVGLTKSRHGGEAGEMIRTVALEVLKRLSQHPKGVPNGLVGPMRAFVDASNIRYELDDALRRGDVALKLGAWGRFTSCYPAKDCVSKNIGGIVKEAEVANPRSLNLLALLALLDNNQVEPEDAEVLGWLQLLSAPEKPVDWNQERLKQLRFRSEAGDWVEARKLLANCKEKLGSDEPKRYRLAPTNCRLHSDYCMPADDKFPRIEFFLAARGRMEASPSDMAGWIRAAETPESRREALEYLLNGKLGPDVAKLVRGKGWLQNALKDPELRRNLSEEQFATLYLELIEPAERAELVAGLVFRPEEKRKAYVGRDLTKTLEKLCENWSKYGREEAAKHRNAVFPTQNLKLMRDPDGKIDRSSWFTLLAIGSFQSIGRTRDGHHRGFVHYCENKGWWQVFTGSDGELEPNKWMNIIEEYGEDQRDDEKWALWFAQFPKFYRLHRWLDDYAELFLSINRMEERFTLDKILAPRTNPELQGGGVDAPPLTRTLKLGSHLVIRELLHRGVIKNPLAIPHAYAPIERIKDFFNAFEKRIESSEDIYKLLKQHLGERDATFGGDYDIPLRIVSSNESLRWQWLRM